MSNAFANVPASPFAALRSDGRSSNQLRPVAFTPYIAPHASGSVLIESGNTRVICAAMIQPEVPRWMKEQKVSGGWLTAEYSMLPYSTLDRKQRDINKGKLDGRSTEIQRLIGRALRAAVDLDRLGPNTLWIDCDVLQADGGTRTASITGACVAAALAFEKLVRAKTLARSPLIGLVAAVSIGTVGGVPMLDLNYSEDKDATVDMNLVMTEEFRFVELQGAGEEASFSDEELQSMLSLGREGIRGLLSAQRAAIQAGIAAL